MINIIPAIDIINGKCVRLIKGDYGNSTVYELSPIEYAQMIDCYSIAEVHIVDLDGAKLGRPCNLKILRDIIDRTLLRVQWGGGVRGASDIRTLFDYGVSRVICGSIAVENPKIFAAWLHRFGGNNIVLAADSIDGNIAIKGWRKISTTSITDLIDTFLPEGLEHVLCTDISHDGMMDGPAYDLYSSLQKRYPSLDIIVSGGISSMSQVKRLNSYGLKSVVIGKALYENKISLNEISLWQQKG